MAQCNPFSKNVTKRVTGANVEKLNSQASPAQRFNLTFRKDTSKGQPPSDFKMIGYHNDTQIMFLRTGRRFDGSFNLKWLYHSFRQQGPFTLLIFPAYRSIRI